MCENNAKTKTPGLVFVGVFENNMLKLKYNSKKGKETINLPGGVNQQCCCAGMPTLGMHEPLVFHVTKVELWLHLRRTDAPA